MSTAGSIAMVVAYVTDTGPGPQGAALAVAMAGFASAAGQWGRTVIPDRVDVEARSTMPSSREDRAAVVATGQVDERRLGGPSTTRRRGLAALLVAAGGSFATALVVPLRSLGPSSRPRREQTQWRAGRRLVDEESRPLRAADLDIGSVATVFPEGDEERSASQVVLVRMEPDEIDASKTRTEWAPRGLVGYSKVCTHAGCPVALYQSETRELLCPCHQSVFLASEGARPTFGPAARALPQLPIGIDDDGFLIALGDFPEPIGPSYWSRP